MMTITHEDDICNASWKCIQHAQIDIKAVPAQTFNKFPKILKF